MKHRKSIYNAVAMVLETNPEQYPKFILLVTFPLFLEPVTLTVIMMFRNRCTSQQTEKKLIHLVALCLTFFYQVLLGVILVAWKQLRRQVMNREPPLGYLIKVENKFTPNVIQEIFSIQMAIV